MEGERCTAALVLTYLLLGLYQVKGEERGDCESPIFNLHGLCLELHDNLSTWENAKNICAGKGGVLPKLVDISKFRDLLLEATVPMWNSYSSYRITDIWERRFWIGASRQGNSDSWKWLDATEVDPDHWCSVQMVKQHQCALSVINGETCWYEEPCEQKTHVICQYELDEIDCKLPRFGWNRTCWEVFNYHTSWFGARDYCQNNNGTLPVLSDDVFTKFYASLRNLRHVVPVHNHDLSNMLYGFGTFWIAAFDAETSGDWKWLDGTSVNAARFCFHNKEGNCGQYRETTAQKDTCWEERKCEEKAFFWCQYGTLPSPAPTTSATPRRRRKVRRRAEKAAVAKRVNGEMYYRGTPIVNTTTHVVTSCYRFCQTKCSHFSFKKSTGECVGFDAAIAPVTEHHDEAWEAWSISK